MQTGLAASRTAAGGAYVGMRGVARRRRTDRFSAIIPPEVLGLYPGITTWQCLAGPRADGFTRRGSFSGDYHRS